MKFLTHTILTIRKAERGFVLPLTLVVCVIILTISAGISVILAKELYFSKLSRLSQIAYYAADSGLMCATMIDDQYVNPDTGMGIFEYNNLVTSQATLDKVNTQRAARGLTPIALNSIKCATSDIFNTAVTGYAVAPFNRVDSAGNTENGRTTTFNMRMDLGGGNTRCATVLINKTALYRQIISRGFATCGSTAMYPIERAIVSTAETAGVAVAPPPPPPQTVLNVVLTNSNGSWTVPAGVTSVKIWAIGGGGGGGNAAAYLNNLYAGGGGAGGVVYKQVNVTPGNVISYSIGSGGLSGSAGGTTYVTLNGLGLPVMTAYGGGAGNPAYSYDGAGGAGGGGIGGDMHPTGGNGGYGAHGSPQMGGGSGGGGGGLYGATPGWPYCGAVTAGQANNILGLFAVLTAAGYQTTAPGASGGCGSPANGQAATGFGSGGGGGGATGGNGAAGRFGGGGGGGSGDVEVYGWVMNGSGGPGGAGAVVISNQ